jgi:hypothetical protein
MTLLDGEFPVVTERQAELELVITDELFKGVNFE